MRGNPCHFKLLSCCPHIKINLPSVRQGFNLISSRLQCLLSSQTSPKKASLLIPFNPTFQVDPRDIPPTSRTMVGLDCEMFLSQIARFPDMRPFQSTLQITSMPSLPSTTTLCPRALAPVRKASKTGPLLRAP